MRNLKPAEGTPIEETSLAEQLSDKLSAIPKEYLLTLKSAIELIIRSRSSAGPLGPRARFGFGGEDSEPAGFGDLPDDILRIVSGHMNREQEYQTGQELIRNVQNMFRTNRASWNFYRQNKIYVWKKWAENRPEDRIVDVASFAIRYNQPEILEGLLEGTENTFIRAIVTTLDAPIIYAASQGYVDIIRLLINAGLSKNFTIPGTRRANGSTLLSVAIENGRQEMIEYLIEIGASLQPSGAKPALHYAIKAGNTELVRFLLELGGEINFLSNFSAVKQLVSRQPDKVELLRMLIDAGLNVNPPNRLTNLNIIDSAVEGGNPEMVRLLLDAGATSRRFTQEELRSFADQT